MDDSAMAIDPSLMSDAAAAAVAKAAPADANGEPVRHTCYFCRGMDSEIDGCRRTLITGNPQSNT